MKHQTFRAIFSIFFAIAIFLVCGFASGGFSLSKSNRTAHADEPQGEYACILQADVFFYATPEESKGLFLLPESYYVKLIDYGAEYCKVAYLLDKDDFKSVIGYVKTTQLTFVPYIPKNPYFFHTFQLRYRIDGEGIADSSFLTEITADCTYYGDYKIGSKTYCYVLREEAFGYVPKPYDFPFVKNTEYEEYLASQENTSSDEEPPKTEPTSSPAQVAILVALCLLVPVLAALILKPPRRPPYETE